MYTEADFRNSKDRARLTSGSFTPSTASCFSFWYHMSGSQIGQLNVKDDEGTSLWTRSGAQGNDWDVARLSIASSVSSMNVSF